MIHESAPWKDELEHCALDLRPFRTDCSEGVPFKLERALFLSAFIVRKLPENHKLTDTVAASKLKVLMHPAIDRGRLAHQREMPGGLEIGEDFSLNGTEAEVPLIVIANQVIHSLALIWIVDDNCVAEGVFVCSDKSQHKKGIQVSLETWCNALESVYLDDIRATHAYTDISTGKMVRRNYGWGENMDDEI